MIGGADTEKRMKHLEAIVLSMTPKERKSPAILNSSRRKRIAGGSGRPVVEINQLLQQFEMMRQLMKNKGMMGQLMSGMMGGGGMPGMPGMPGMGGRPGMGGGKGGFPGGMPPGLGGFTKPKKPKKWKF